MTPEVPTTTGRILALDLGVKRIGVAVSDELQISVRPLPAITVTNWKAVLEAIRNAVAHFDAKLVVIGWPLTMDGLEGTQVELVRNTAVKLGKSLTVPIEFQDERLTSMDAENRLRAEGIPKQEWKQRVDSLAASIILSDYIERTSGPPLASSLLE